MLSRQKISSSIHKISIKSNPVKHLIDGVAHNFEARLGSNDDGDVGVGVKAIEIVILA